MDPGALAALPVVLAGVLLVSGVLKIGDRSNTAASMVDLRVPFAARLGWFAAWQPWLEIALAVALLALPGWGALAAGWVAVLFFALLTGLVLGAALREGDVHCNCFGAHSREPVGWMTVLRNLALTAVAVLVALGVSGTGGFVAEVAGLDRQSVTWLVVLTVGAAAFGLLWFRGAGAGGAGAGSTVARSAGAGGPDAQAGQAGQVDPADPADPAADAARAVIGFDASDEELVTPQGEVLRIRQLAGGRALLLVFVQRDCQPCSVVVAALPSWMAALAPAVTVRVATSATPSELAGAYPALAGDALHGARGLRTALGVSMLPAAVLLGTDLTVSAGPVLGFDEIEALVEGIVDALALNDPAR